MNTARETPIGATVRQSHEGYSERLLTYWFMAGLIISADSILDLLLYNLSLYTIAKTVVFLYLTIKTHGSAHFYSALLKPALYTGIHGIADIIVKLVLAGILCGKSLVFRMFHLVNESATSPARGKSTLANRSAIEERRRQVLAELVSIDIAKASKEE